jgi:uncharacterized lipoprotein YajG
VRIRAGIAASIAVGAVFLPAACVPPPAALTCTASVSNAQPYQNQQVLVYTHTQAASRVTTVAHYKTTDSQVVTVANVAGLGTSTYNISRAARGYRVKVSVAVVKGSQHASCSTYFTPR